MALLKPNNERPEQQELFNLTPSPPLPQKTPRNIEKSGTFLDNMALPVHRWYRYSAGFSAEWAEKIIREHSPKTILDPFVGSGTTLLAATAVGVKAYGYESHPFVARIAEAKNQWNASEKHLLDAGKALLHNASCQIPSHMEAIPDLLAKCYTPETLRQLYALRYAYLSYADESSPAIKKLLWLAITSILRACSFVGTAQWQYVLPKKRKSASIEPFPAFEQKILQMASDMSLFQKKGYLNNATVLFHDARRTQENISHEQIDFVLTSPPYPNNYDYADATRLEMTFWGEINGWGDLQSAVRQFIIRSCSQHATAEKLRLDTLLSQPFLSSIREDLSVACHHLAEIRKTKGGKKAYHTMIAAYFYDLAQVFQRLRAVCKTTSTLCFVIGDSAPYGVYIPVDDWLGRLAIAAGFKSFSFEKLRDRNIKWKNRKHDVPLFEGRLWIQG